jgi:hypothetical protein
MKKMTVSQVSDNTAAQHFLGKDLDKIIKKWFAGSNIVVNVKMLNDDYVKEIRIYDKAEVAE